jgi:hypothetical protein
MEKNSWVFPRKKNKIMRNHKIYQVQRTMDWVQQRFCEKATKCLKSNIR